MGLGKAKIRKMIRILPRFSVYFNRQNSLILVNLVNLQF
ncbi:hypothetical protein D1AOALGA4SA_10785 [Olavius algarvensis Delta 1 endosymbiont]|nr:hypothetical protein D1AOALGA4SA_10785 [Olavius algarvensis Delta 1 endosymbiont]